MTWNRRGWQQAEDAPYEETDFAGQTRRHHSHRPVRAARVILILSSLLGIGGIGIAGYAGVNRVALQGVCLANPLSPGSAWPYDPSAGRLTLRYYFEAGAPGSYAKVYRIAAAQSFRAWMKAWPVLHFVAAQKVTQAQIVIRYGWYGVEGYWYQHAGLTLPQVSLLGCSLTHVAIDINNSYLVQDDRLEYPMPMLNHLFAHEIGHALGLKHVYKAVASVMIPTSAAYRYTVPQPYDIRTVAELYPRLTPGHRVTAVAESPHGLTLGSSFRLPTRLGQGAATANRR